ncbi:hypothetical protein ACU61A_15700 [Pseudonocardia sichuanensis]
MHEPVRWRGLFVVRKFWADDDLARARPYDTVEAENLLMTAGATALWNRLAGLGSVVAFDATNGHLCVGSGTQSADNGQTDLQGASKTRKVFDAAPSISSSGFTAVATFGPADANHAWEEAGVANAAVGGVLLNRVVQSFGTKTSSVQWVLTASLTLQGA